MASSLRIARNQCGSARFQSESMSERSWSRSWAVISAAGVEAVGDRLDALFQVISPQIGTAPTSRSASTLTASSTGSFSPMHCASPVVTARALRDSPSLTKTRC